MDLVKKERENGKAMRKREMRDREREKGVVFHLITCFADRITESVNEKVYFDHFDLIRREFPFHAFQR